MLLWVTDFPREYFSRSAITVDDDTDGIRDGGFGSTTK